MPSFTKEQYMLSVNWQIPVHLIPDKLWDVVIIGAGPAGSTAAFHLSRKGHQVLLLDMAHFPRQKICGDCMITDVEPNLNGLGLSQTLRTIGHKLSGLSVYSPSRHNFTIPGQFITLKRPIFDTLLAHNAVDAGATFSVGHVTGLDLNADESVTVKLKGLQSTVHAKFAILATGAHIGLARKLGIVTKEKPSAVAMRCYVRSPEQGNYLVMCYERNLLPGYGWIVPLGEREYNVGCGHFLGHNHKMNIHRCFESFTNSCPPAKHLMDRAQIHAPLRSGAIRCGLTGASPLYRHSIVLTGETIGTTFPLTGEGIGQAMTTGAIAAAVIGDAIARNDRRRLEQYPAILKSKLRPRHEGFRYAQKWASRPWVNDLIARRVKKSKYLQKACAEFVTNSHDPGQVYSIKALLTSFFK